jgi:hypothetical protein
MWHIDPFLGSDSERDNGMTFVAREQIFNKQEQTAAAMEWHGKHIPKAMDVHVIDEQCFLHGPC